MAFSVKEMKGRLYSSHTRNPRKPISKKYRHIHGIYKQKTFPQPNPLFLLMWVLCKITLLRLQHLHPKSWIVYSGRLKSEEKLAINCHFWWLANNGQAHTHTYPNTRHQTLSVLLQEVLESCMWLLANSCDVMDGAVSPPPPLSRDFMVQVHPATSPPTPSPHKHLHTHTHSLKQKDRNWKVRRLK